MVDEGQVLIRTHRTLISAGTERALMEFGQATWIERAHRNPDKVKMVLEKLKADGLAATIAAVGNKLSRPHPMGYCNVGTVIDVGPGVIGLRIGDRVASNGGHAEVVCVPQNLCVRVPSGVLDEDAVFTVLGAIALHGIRLLQPSLGEHIVVIGLGLIGLLAVQLLRAQGCRVLGIDFDSARLGLAKRFGAEAIDLGAVDPVSAAMTLAGDAGVDGVLIAASTSSSAPVSQAAKMCRRRGRIVLVGVTGLDLSRADFYQKELSFQVSCSYGPGRYDPEYEEKGHDYPIGYVRWTERRNFEAVLEMLAEKRLEVGPLVSHRVPIEHAERAYALVGAEEKTLGIVLEYSSNDEESPHARTLPTGTGGTPVAKGQTVGFVGSGDYANSVLMPAFKGAGARLKVVASSGGLTGAHAARRHGFELTTTDAGVVFSDQEVAAVVVATRNDSHARYVLRAIESGKHVFVEKPLALTESEIDAIEQASKTREGAVMMVGFNRRFAPHVVKAKALLQVLPQPMSLVMTVNAGAVPPEHWTRDPKSGGGRIIGEVCHFIDLFRFLVGSPIAEHKLTQAATSDVCASISLRFSDGSMGTIHYLSNGHRALPKERLEVFCGGRVLQLENFRMLRGFGWPGFRSMKLWRQDKGQKACVEAFVSAIRDGTPSPIPLSELIEVARITLAIAAAAKA